MLVLVWSLCLFFTAIITKTLSKTVKGQVMLLMIMVMIKLFSQATFRVSPSVVKFVRLLVKFERETLAMLRRKRYEVGCFSEVYFLF